MYIINCCVLIKVKWVGEHLILKIFKNVQLGMKCEIIKCGNKYTNTSKQ